ncbi:uncharacterized protein V6R79_012637 [Siganus canaliculatus]
MSQTLCRLILPSESGVTLKFGFQVELCRVDVELWPCGMDGGQVCRRLEISTSSYQPPSRNTGPGREQINERKQMQGEHQNERRRDKQQSHHYNGHQWSHQAKQWGREAVPEPQQKDHVSKYQSNTTNSEPQYKVVGRCELRQETRVCFTRSNFRPRPPFPSPPPPQPADCREVELWSHGPLSLGAVTHLRVTVPFSGAASALGLKALVVWGTPARCCPPEEVERITRVHEANKRQKPRSLPVASSVSHTKPGAERTTLGNISIPEEFLDPITQELMMLPMLLPSGMSVDRTTLEEHQKREATWGRPPNDPFTGVPFTSTSQPLPNPHLKSRIDHFLLQSSLSGRDGMLGRQGDGQNPQSSRLIASRVEKQKQNSSCLSKSSTNSTVQCHAATRNTNTTVQNEGSGVKHLSDIKRQTSHSQPLSGGDKSLTGRKRDLNQDSPPQTKRPRNDAVSFPSCSSHEQRLSASLDEALFSALQGRPSFTSNLSQQKQVSPVSKPGSPSQQGQTACAASEPSGEKRCSACSRSVSVYSKAASSIYRLTCGHLLCRSCLQKESKPPNTVTTPTSSSFLCAACQSLTLRSDIVRVHH